MKTQKVRVAVAINDKGHWNACGFWKFGDEEASSVAMEGLDEECEQENLHWIEAEIPVPEALTFTGTVVPKRD